MGFKRSNSKTVSERKAMDNLLELISTSNNSDLQHEVDMHNLRVAFTSGFDSKESEQVEYRKSDPDTEANRQYATRKDSMRNASLNRSTGPNVRELNATPLSDANAVKSRDFSGFAKHPDQPSIRTSAVVYDSFKHGAGQHGRG